MNISKRDKKLLIYVGSILLLVLVYFLFYRNMLDSNKKIEREISTLTEECDRLTALSAKAGEYTVETENMNKEISSILLKFPADMREEDSIVYGNTLELFSGMKISYIGIGTKQLLYSTESGEELHLYDMPVEYRFTVDYESLKKVAGLIMQNTDKRNMDALTLAYDNETGKLIGTAAINMYYVLGTDREYKVPDLLPIPQGVDNIFGTLGDSTQTDTGGEDTDEEDTDGEDTDEEDTGVEDTKDTGSKKKN